MVKGKEESKIVGSIYPVPASLIEHIFKDKTVVFVKYTAHDTTKLAPGHKIIFYASQGTKQLVGEATISELEFLTPDKVLAKYKDHLFLNEDEFRCYVKRYPSRTYSKRILTFVLKSLKKYPQSVSYSKPLTMAGQYFSVNEYRSLFPEQIEKKMRRKLERAKS